MSCALALVETRRVPSPNEAKAHDTAEAIRDCSTTAACIRSRRSDWSRGRSARKYSESLRPEQLAQALKPERAACNNLGSKPRGLA